MEGEGPPALLIFILAPLVKAAPIFRLPNLICACLGFPFFAFGGNYFNWLFHYTSFEFFSSLPVRITSASALTRASPESRFCTPGMHVSQVVTFKLKVAHTILLLI